MDSSLSFPLNSLPSKCTGKGESDRTSTVWLTDWLAPMRNWHIVSVGSLCFCFVVSLYFGLYFLFAHYVDVGDGNSYYLLSYHVRGQSLNPASWVFEPARTVDLRALRPRYRNSSMFFRQDGSVVDIIAGD